MINEKTIIQKIKQLKREQYNITRLKDYLYNENSYKNYNLTIEILEQMIKDNESVKKWLTQKD